MFMEERRIMFIKLTKLIAIKTVNHSSMFIGITQNSLPVSCIYAKIPLCYKVYIHQKKKSCTFLIS